MCQQLLGKADAMEIEIASLYRELMDDPLRCAGPGELESDQPTEDLIYDESGLVIGAAGKLASDEPFDSFERRDRLNDREWEEGK
jgi:hypothetical protein